MPETITDAETGEDREVPTKEEMEGYKKNEETIAANTEAITKSDTVIKELKEENEKLNADPGNRDFKGLREANTRYIAKLGELGKSVNEKGEIVDSAPKSLSAEEIEGIATKATDKRLVTSKVQGVLGNLDKDAREVVEKNYGKLTKDEDVTLDNYAGYLDQAIKSAGVTKETNPLGDIIQQSGDIGGGNAPRQNQEENFTETEGGKGLADILHVPTKTQAEIDAEAKK